MKILQVTNSFKYAWGAGGMARVAYDLSRYLVNRGHAITVFATEKGLPNEVDIRRNSPVEIDNIETYYFRNVSKYLAQRTFTIPYRLPFVARERLKEFDIIHIHDYRRLSVLIMHYYARKYNVPYVLQAHGSLTTFFQKGWLKRTFDAVWGYRILKDASKVIALNVTEALQYRSMGIGQDKIEIIPNGIDLSEFENLPQWGEFRRKYGLNNNQKVILYLGRIHQTKGLDLLVKVFAQLSGDIKDVKLVIVGPDSGYLPALKELIKELKIEEKVVFTGPLYGTNKLRAYVDADIFTNPRIDEIFGLVFLEALACGTPVICSRGCGIADVIDGQVGLAVPYDKNALTQAMLDILSHEEKRREFGERGKLLVREKFEWHKIAEHFEKVYQSIVEMHNQEKQ